jgi:hypothetical protein
MFAKGHLETDFMATAQIAYHFDMFPSLPGGFKGLEKGVRVVLFSGRTMKCSYIVVVLCVRETR